MLREREPYRCRQCGATSYGRLTHRDARGVMTYSGVYRCSGCRLTFKSLAEWRDGEAAGTSDRTFGAGAQVPPASPEDVDGRNGGGAAANSA